MSAEFFFDRFQRAVQMDSTNQILGRDCHFIREATDWLEAYKSSLGTNKRKDFDKEWRKCELALASARKFADFGKK